jgi:hypothetical protein
MNRNVGHDERSAEGACVLEMAEGVRLTRRERKDT